MIHKCEELWFNNSYSLIVYSPIGNDTSTANADWAPIVNAFIQSSFFEIFIYLMLNYRNHPCYYTISEKVS